MTCINDLKTPAPSFTCGPVFGYDVIENDLATKIRESKQFRFPKSKKKRIRKKWSKRKANWRMEDVFIAIQRGRTIYMHSSVIEKFESGLKMNVSTGPQLNPSHNQ